MKREKEKKESTIEMEGRREWKKEAENNNNKKTALQGVTCS